MYKTGDLLKHKYEPEKYCLIRFVTDEMVVYYYGSNYTISKPLLWEDCLLDDFDEPLDRWELV